MRVSGPPSVLHIQPFNGKDLAARSLPDRLGDLEELAILYPNKLKKEAFEKFKVYEGNQQLLDSHRRMAYVQATMRLVVLPPAESTDGTNGFTFEQSDLNAFDNLQNLSQSIGFDDSNNYQF